MLASVFILLPINETLIPTDRRVQTHARPEIVNIELLLPIRRKEGEFCIQQIIAAVFSIYEAVKEPPGADN